MNTKRQTVWLVSMLSLMVILSAYYLFTDRVDELDKASETDNTGQLVTIDEIVLDEHVDGIVEEELTDVALPDQQILEDIKAGAKTGEDYLSALIMKRNDEMYKEQERLLGITIDPKKTDAEVEQAQDEMASIEDMQYRISDLEDQLMQEFENVVITEDKGKWKAVVQANKLERSQAVSIMEMMMTNLLITPNKIAGVQFVQ